MIYQQQLIIQEISKALTYTNLEININFNATEFSEEINKTFTPLWKDRFNQSITEQWGKDD
jgi:ABC-type amino acid transport substrate-binding protein